MDVSRLAVWDLISINIKRSPPYSQLNLRVSDAEEDACEDVGQYAGEAWPRT